MKAEEKTPCVVCEKPVSQVKARSENRQTCKGKTVDGVYIKSECEMEKNRRYQKEYRRNNPQDGTPKAKLDRSVALCSMNHLAKYKARKYKRRCLKCGKKFTGIGAYNRICKKCEVDNSRVKPLRGVT